MQADKVIDPLQTPPEPIECPWCHSKYAPRLYGWHERTEDGHYQHRYTVRCLNCGAQGPKKEIGPNAIESWNRRADDADRARLVARVAELEAGIRAMYQIDQSQDSRMDIYARGFNQGVDFAETEQAKVLELRQEELVNELATQAARIAELERENEELSRMISLEFQQATRIGQLERELESLKGDDWGRTVDYLISLAPEPEPPLPEPPDDWDDGDDEDKPYYDSPGGY